MATRAFHITYILRLNTHRPTAALIPLNSQHSSSASWLRASSAKRKCDNIDEICKKKFLTYPDEIFSFPVGYFFNLFPIYYALAVFASFIKYLMMLHQAGWCIKYWYIFNMCFQQQQQMKGSNVWLKNECMSTYVKPTNRNIFV